MGREAATRGRDHEGDLPAAITAMAEADPISFMAAVSAWLPDALIESIRGELFERGAEDEDWIEAILALMHESNLQLDEG
jgi:hypothetical protein